MFLVLFLVVVVSFLFSLFSFSYQDLYENLLHCRYSIPVDKENSIYLTLLQYGSTTVLAYMAIINKVFVIFLGYTERFVVAYKYCSVPLGCS